MKNERSVKVIGSAHRSPHRLGSFSNEKEKEREERPRGIEIGRRGESDKEMEKREREGERKAVEKEVEKERERESEREMERERDGDLSRSWNFIDDDVSRGERESEKRERKEREKMSTSRPVDPTWVIKIVIFGSAINSKGNLIRRFCGFEVNYAIGYTASFSLTLSPSSLVLHFLSISFL